jgi:hypothetical protein
MKMPLRRQIKPELPWYAPACGILDISRHKLRSMK